MPDIVETQQTEPVRYDSLILVIFTAEELQHYREQYATSETLTIFDIARQMKADAQDVVNTFDFLDFAETVLQQTDFITMGSKTSTPRKKTRLLQRL